MTKSKNDIEVLFGKLLGSANSFNTINTFNQNAKDIFRDKSFKVEDVSDELNNIIDNISSEIDDKFDELKEKPKENLFYEDKKENKEFIEQIGNEISKVAENIDYDLESYENREFNLKYIKKNLTASNLKEAIVLTEILGKPISKRRRNRNRGYR